MKNCLSFLFVKKKIIINKTDIINKEKEISNLNASSSKLEIFNKCNSPISKYTQNEKIQYYNDNIYKNTQVTPIHKKFSKNCTNSQDKSISINNITRSRSIHARYSKININKITPSSNNKKKKIVVNI